MKRMNVTCDNCAGTGRDLYLELTSKNTFQSKGKVCPNCDGKGYTEYAMFSIEEAEAILKHCGLSIEGD